MGYMATGAQSLSKIYRGTTEVNSVYRGTQLVWDNIHGFYSYEAEKSARFEGTHKLTRTETSTAGSRTTFTYSTWFRDAGSTGTRILFGSGVSGDRDALYLYNGGLDFNYYNGSTYPARIAVGDLTDSSGWYHVVVKVDTTQANADDRLRLYVNGTQPTRTAFTAPPQNFQFKTTGNVGHAIGSPPYDSLKWVGYICESQLIDGLALGPEEFGEFRAGVWMPKQYTGSYGTCGFYIPTNSLRTRSREAGVVATAPSGGNVADAEFTDNNLLTTNTSTGSGFTVLEYDLLSDKTVNRINIARLLFTGGASTFEVQYKVDGGSTWTTATSMSVSASASTYRSGYEFADVSARYWRLRATAFGTNGYASLDSFHVEDLRQFDASGRGRHFLADGFTAANVTRNTPTMNFCTHQIGGSTLMNLNPVSYDRGAQRIKNDSAASANGIGTMLLPLSGKYYWETYVHTKAGANDVITGIVKNSGFADGGSSFYRSDGDVVLAGVTTSGYATYAQGDYIGIALDMDINQISFYKNGTFIASGNATEDNARYVPWVQMNNSGDRMWVLGIDERDDGSYFTYPGPADHKPLATTYLPEPADVFSPLRGNRPKDSFKAVTYTGTGGNNDVAVGFQPDLVWVKSRGSSNNHTLFDSLRPGKLIAPNTTAAEIGGSNVTITSNGFNTTSSAGIINASGIDYVAWCWKLNDPVVDNTGGIQSTVAANQDLGVSVVKFTATGGGNTGTGLDSSRPLDMAIVKATSTTTDWQVGHRHSGQGSNFAYHMNLNDAAALSGISPFHMGSNSTTNGSQLYLASGITNGVSTMALCFQSVPGFSHFGFFEGNGNVDGPYVNVGFRPAFIMLKCVDLNNWLMFDTARDLANPNYNTLYANLTNVEYTSTAYVTEIFSNGFKLGGTSSDLNRSGSRIVYAAFAEMPFKYANAR